MENLFDLRGLREEMTFVISELNNDFNKIIRPQTHKAAKYLNEKSKHLNIEKKENIEVCVFYNIETNSNGELGTFSNFPLPINLITELL